MIFTNETGGLVGCMGNTYKATPQSTRYVLAVARMQLGFPNILTIAKAVGTEDPAQSAYRWGKGFGISQYYMVRLLHLLQLRHHDPEFWTPQRLTRIDWEAIGPHHELGISVDIDVEAPSGKERRDHAVSARRSGMSVVPSRTDRPIAAFKGT